MDMDIDDENDWKAMDSDEEVVEEAGEEEVERDDDVDIGFRNHNFQYGSHGRNRKRSRRENQEEAIYGVFYDNHHPRNHENNLPNTAPMFVKASKPEPAPMFVSATKKENNDASPMFVSATKKDSVKSNDASPMFVSASKPPTKSDANSVTAETNPMVVNHTKVNNPSNQEDPEQEEEERIRQEQKEADERFQELLQQAKSRNKSSRTRPFKPEPDTTTHSSIPQDAGLGMTPAGFPSTFGGLGFSSATKDPTVGTWEKHTKGFGSKLLAKMGWKGSGGLGSNRRTFRGEAAKRAESKQEPDATAATATTTETETTQNVKKGISRPVEVVVRPTSMGLGFGNFKEASQLKSNRRIEAEVRGIDYDAQLAKEKKEARDKRKQQRRQRYGNQYEYSSEEDNDEQENDSSKVQSSAIPTTQDLLSKQSWKAKRKSKRHKKNLPEIIPYQELIQRQNQTSDNKVVIIDMRGPDPTSSSNTTKTVALGEELLYNLSFLLGTYENKLHSSSRHHETTILRTIRGLDNQIQDAEDRLQKAANRRNKLAKAHDIAEAVRNEGSPTQKRKVHNLVMQLKDIFTPSERTELQFWNVLAPTLLGPTMQSMLQHWKPFRCTNRNEDRLVIDSFFEWATTPEGRILCESMVRNQLIPKLKADIEAQAFETWDPITNPYTVLDLYEYLRAKALAFDNSDSVVPATNDEMSVDDSNQVFPSNPQDEDNESKAFEHRTNLAEWIRNELIRDAVHPKLLGAVTTWKPTLSENKLQNPLHLWVLPWLVHMDYPILLSNLLVECKRKLKSSLSVLQRGGRTHTTVSGVKRIVDVIRPWCTILGTKSIHKLVSENTKILVGLEKLFLDSFSNSQTENDWKNLLLLLFDLHSSQLFSDVDFLSLVEGPFLTSWAKNVHSFLSGRNASFIVANNRETESTASSRSETAVEAYRQCKILVLVDPSFGSNENKASSRSINLLRQDDRICRIFFSVVHMIQIHHTTTTSTEPPESELLSLEPEIKSLSAIRNRRSLEEKEQSHATVLGESRQEQKAKAVLRRRNILEPTFREVVEAFAADRGVVFRPKPGATRDGKQVYLFGTKSLYLDGDVAFCQDGGNQSWKPMSLEQLGTMVS